MNIKNPISGQTKQEEIANSLTHGFGCLLSAAGLTLLVVFASLYGNAWHIVACSIYGATLVILYLASTIYHLTDSNIWKKRLQIADHISIYLLIAGTYTPFTFIKLGAGWGWSIFGVEWGLALTGIVATLLFNKKSNLVSTLAYLGMGWLILIAIFPLSETLSFMGFIWLFLGGLSYSIGVIFYLWESLPYHHAIWHLFVLGGSICHYFAILFHVLPDFIEV